MILELIATILSLVGSWMVYKKMGRQGCPHLQHLCPLPGAVRQRLEIPPAPDPLL